jgi:hypothetical protein
LKADKNGVTKTKLADVSNKMNWKPVFAGGSKPGMCGTDGKRKDVDWFRCIGTKQGRSVQFSGVYQITRKS